jgi:Cft2 family RNA processing exonuclease
VGLFGSIKKNPMLLKVVSTGSIGNSYLLETEDEAIILECGVPISKIKKAIDYNISKIKGALITHQHL